jgi:hypothetical protein
MKPPTDRAQHLLERFKASQGMAGPEKARLLGVIQERVGRGDLPRFDVLAAAAAIPEPSLLQRLWSSSLGKLGLGLALAGPAALGISQLRGDDASSIAPPAALAHSTPLPTAAAPLAPAAPAVSERPTTKPPAEARLVPNNAARPRPSAAASSTIDEEMRLMNAAQDALRGGQPQRALSLLNEHSERFPSGKLSSARSVTRMMALCQAGSGEQARREADQFLVRYPSSPFVDRVKTICR